MAMQYLAGLFHAFETKNQLADYSLVILDLYIDFR